MEGGTWNMVVQVVVPLFGVVVPAWIGIRSIQRAGSLQLKQQHHIKLVEMAHAAAEAVTAAAYAGVKAHQAWIGARFRDPEALHGEQSLTAHEARGALRRASSCLPPALCPAFDALLKAYEKLDADASHVHVNREHPDGAAQSIMDFLNALDVWLVSVRGWRAKLWQETGVA